MLHSDYRKKKVEEFKERVALRNKKKGDEKTDNSEAGNDDEKSDKPQEEIIKGTLLKITNIPEGLSREQFKEKWYEATNEEDFKVSKEEFS